MARTTIYIYCIYFVVEKKTYPCIFTNFFSFQVLTGVGFAICISCLFQSMLDMSIITWSGQAFYLLFADPENSKNFEDFFYGKVLKLEDGSGLDNLGVLQGELSLCLGIACIVIFILIAAGTKSVGKVSHFVLHCSATEIFHFSKNFGGKKLAWTGHM